jgi:signal transduction histidine kinase/ActR/RegA family two-component response regulator
VLLVFTASTAAGTAYVRQSVQLRDQLRFEAATQDFRAALQGRIDTYVALLHAGDALFAATDNLSRRAFHAFVEHLDLLRRFPGIQGIGFAAAVTADAVPALEAEMRRQGTKGFRVWPTDPPRALYTPILFLEPLDDRNQAALGFDMFSDETRRVAMEQARDSGRAVSSGKVILKQEIDPAETQAGFLIYLPVYRGGIEPRTVPDRVAALEGFVYAPFRAGDLLVVLLGDADDGLLDMRIYDGESSAPGDLLYDSAPGEDLASARFRSTTRLNIAGRPWTLEVAAQSSFGGTSPLLVPSMLVIGVLISLLLFALTAAEARARASAEAAADALRRSEEDLLVASRAKDEFLATLSHELRTPLNAILGWARMLRTGHLSEGRRETALAVIERNARAQAQLIEDLLDVSRIITGKLRLDLHAVPLNAALEEAINTVRPAAEAKGVTLSWTPDPSAGTIYAAPDRLQQIVWNLLSNAIKFTPAGGRVDLATNRTATDARIAVHDTGKGIAPSFLPHVFERFRQADSSSTRTHSGVGLGLAIVRHLVELHGGSIEAASEGEGRGATFTVRLPVQRAEAAPPAGHLAGVTGPDVQAGHPRRRLEGLRVLVVDDEPDGRELTHDALVHEGAIVESAASVAAAAAALDLGTFDVVVTDLAMPDADGFALLRRLRADTVPGRRHLPVIAVTAYAGPDHRERVLAEGFQGFLGKPLELDRLIDMVAELARADVQNEK